MENNEGRMDQLRKKRAQMQGASDQDRLRVRYGENLVSAIVEATGKPLLLDDFNDKGESPPIEWPADIRDAVGLVAAYISRADADRLLACVRDKLIAFNGRIGFHEKRYLGSAELHDVDPVSLLAVAETTEDSVVFYSDAPAGIVMVDCYTSQPSGPFSVVVQGDELVQQLAPCFQAERPG